LPYWSSTAAVSPKAEPAVIVDGGGAVTASCEAAAAVTSKVRPLLEAGEVRPLPAARSV
jgi:hypothetical protein